MAIEVDGVTYFEFGRALAVDANGNPVEGLTGGVVTLPNSADPLPMLEFPSQVPLASVSSGALGIIPAAYVACGVKPVTVLIDFPDDDIPPQEWDPRPAEVVGYVESVAAAAGADAVIAAQAAQAAAESAAEATQGTVGESAPTPNMGVRRDDAGRAQVADPAVDADIATRGWTLTNRFPLGSAENPVTDPAAARPSGIAVVWWVVDSAPANAQAGDMVLLPEDAAPPSATVLYSETFDATGVGGWGAMTNATAPTRDTTSDAGGTATVASLRWTSAAAGTTASAQGPLVFVDPTTVITLRVAVRNAAGASRVCYIGCHEYAPDGAYVANRNDAANQQTVAPGASYTDMAFTFTTSGGINRVRPFVVFRDPAAAGEPFHADNVRIEQPA